MLEEWIIQRNLATPGGEEGAMGKEWFKELRDEAIAAGLMDEITAKPEGMRQVARDYFQCLKERSSREAEEQSKDIGMPSSSSDQPSSLQEQEPTKAEKEQVASAEEGQEKDVTQHTNAESVEEPAAKAEEPAAKAEPTKPMQDQPRHRRKITAQLESWIIRNNMEADGGASKAMGTSFFKTLKKQAIQEGMMSEDTASPEGMRQVVRDHFYKLGQKASKVALACIALDAQTGHCVEVCNYVHCAPLVYACQMCKTILVACSCEQTHVLCTKCSHVPAVWPSAGGLKMYCAEAND